MKTDKKYLCVSLRRFKIRFSKLFIKELFFRYLMPYLLNQMISDTQTEMYY